MADKVSQEDIEAFQRDGAVCLRGLFAHAWVEKVAEGIQKSEKNPSSFSERLVADGGPGSYFNDYCNWRNVPEFVDYVHNSPAAEIVCKLMQSKYAAFFHEHVLVKDPGAHKATPWHHDQAYYPLDGFKTCSIWMPVNPVSQETTIQFVRGSHRWGRWFHPRLFASSNNYPIQEKDWQGQIYEQVPDIEGEKEKYDIIQWEVQPGDCVVFHMQSLHGAPPNTTDTPRRILSTRWTGDDCVVGERPWVTSPPVHLTHPGLKPGEPFISDASPVIFRADQ